MLLNDINERNDLDVPDDPKRPNAIFAGAYSVTFNFNFYAIVR